MKLLHSIDTCFNAKGLISLSHQTAPLRSPSVSDLSPSSQQRTSSSETSGSCGYLAYPANPLSGQVLIMDTATLQSVNIIQAHKSPISTLTFNQEGTLLATASETGTIIRIFSVPEGKRLYQLRRGSLSARITHLSFNMQSNFLCVCSNSGTLHIFKLGNGGFLNPSLSRSSSTSKIIETGSSLIGSLLPALNEFMEPSRDFARIRLLDSSTSSTDDLERKSSTGSDTVPNSQNDGRIYAIAGMSSTKPQVVVVSSDGYYREYSIDLEVGGDCQLLKQYRI